MLRSTLIDSKKQNKKWSHERWKKALESSKRQTKTTVCANAELISVHYSSAESKTNINISNINMNSH